jgi:autotransporter-associated beta strand protein
VANIVWNGNSPTPPPNPVGLYQDPQNWQSFTIPGEADIAVFGLTAKYVVSLSGNISVGEWHFTSLAYTFLLGSGSVSIGFAGAGITSDIDGGGPTIENDGEVRFTNSSAAGSATIDNTNRVEFYDTSSAASAEIENDRTVSFSASSTAANSTITNNASLNFREESTAGNANITNLSTDLSEGIRFYNQSSAGYSNILNSAYCNVIFFDDSSAGNAEITTDGVGYITFLDSSSASESTLTNNGFLDFRETSSAGNSTIVNSAFLGFSGASSAAGAIIANSNTVTFTEGSTGGNARLDNDGTVNFSDVTNGAPTLGSLSGSGSVNLGSNKLSIGSRGINTSVSGIISGDGGSLVKTGAGKMILAGQNTYTGGTTVSGGILQVDGKIGSAVVKNGATLAGKGVVGAVTVETGGTLAPGASAGRLSTGNLVLKGEFALELGGTTPGTQYDQVKVTGTVTLTGSTLSAALTGGFQPSKTTSQTFVVIDNNGADAVVGTFARGPGVSGAVTEGTSVVFNGRFFEVSYTGGTGNDVTLTSLGISGGGGTNGNNTIGGSAFDDVLLGLRGNDKLTALAGNDRLQGDAGNDTLNGGDGTDIAVYGSVAWKDLLVTKSGSTYTVKDLRSGSPLGTDTLTNIERISIGGKESSIANALRAAPTATAMTNKIVKEGVAFSFDASAHFADRNTVLGDVLTYSIANGPAWLKINAATGVLSGTPGINDQSIRKVTIVATDSLGSKVATSFGLTVKDVVSLIIGNNKSQTIEGTISTDHILGKGGNDKLFGLAGKDRLDGGDGSDLLIGGPGADSLVGGKGADTASYEDAKKGVTASLTQPKANTGDAKGDTYSSIENLTGSKRADTLTGNAGGNVVDGLAGDDTLHGKGGDDTLKGFDGKDRLEGGLGKDRLIGGKQGDQFIFTTIEDSPFPKKGWDTIADFSRAQKDKINLKAIDSIAGTKNNDAFAFIGTDAFSKTKGELRYEKAGKTTFVYADVNGDGKADLAIALAGKIDLMTADFVL